MIFRCLPSKHLFAALALCAASSVYAQAVPYARNYAFPRDKVEHALKEMQAYSGQKLPALEGFVAATEKPLDHYERGFYQFSIELLPGDPNGTVVRLTAKITAWYADRDVTKSGYQVLPSNGRLELDFLDRLEEKLTGKIPTAAAAAPVQSPRPKLDLSGVRGAATMAGPTPQPAQPSDELATVRNQRVAAEKRVAQLTHELQNLQEIQHTQGHPQNLVIVRKSGTPVFAKGAENSRVLFEAAAQDEFEFLDADADWIHITISGDSRGYVRADAVDLPERVGRTSSSAPALEAKFPGLRVEREETTSFPGDWVQLKGKLAKIYTVKPVSQNPKESGPAIRLNYCLALFEKSLRELAAAHPAPEGVVVIFDSADGGIAAATFADIEKLSSGALKREAFWQQSYQDPPEAFSSVPKP